MIAPRTSSIPPPRIWFLLSIWALLSSFFFVSPIQAQEADKKGEETPAVETKVSDPPVAKSTRKVSTTPDAAPAKSRYRALMVGLTIFLLALFVGFEVIAKVPPTLHTPLMSGSNAISGITVVGSIIAAGSAVTATAGSSETDLWRWFASIAGLVAVALAMINVVGGFWVTHRMLGMFRGKSE